MSNILLNKKPNSIQELRETKNPEQLKDKLIITYMLDSNTSYLLPYFINGNYFHKAISQFINAEDFNKLPYESNYYPNNEVSQKYAFYISNKFSISDDLYLLNIDQKENYLFKTKDLAIQKYKNRHVLLNNYTQASTPAYIIQYSFSTSSNADLCLMESKNISYAPDFS